ncbi:hypothetical protein M885DRAFT_321245, partial [Pelagophyceae sp. CCMP2097]
LIFGAYNDAPAPAPGGADRFFFVRIEEQLFVDVQDLVEPWFGALWRQTGKYTTYASTYLSHGPLAFPYGFGAGRDSAALEGVDFKKVWVKMDEGAPLMERPLVTCSLLRARLGQPAFGLTHDDAKSIAKCMDEGRFVPINDPAAIVAFAAKIFSNDSECQLKFDGKILTLGQRLQPKQKTFIVAMINHTHRTAHTIAHIPKLRAAVA